MTPAQKDPKQVFYSPFYSPSMTEQHILATTLQGIGGVLFFLSARLNRVAGGLTSPYIYIYTTRGALEAPTQHRMT